jgi:hypothetical protein
VPDFRRVVVETTGERLDQQVVEADLAELVDQDRGVA